MFFFYDETFKFKLQSSNKGCWLSKSIQSILSTRPLDPLCLWRCLSYGYLVLHLYRSDLIFFLKMVDAVVCLWLQSLLLFFATKVLPVKNDLWEHRSTTSAQKFQRCTKALSIIVHHDRKRCHFWLFWCRTLIGA